MIPISRRNPVLTFLALLVLVCSLAERCSALILLRNVTKEEAKELGVTVRLLPREDDVRVQIDFKTTGAMKNFRWADLELTQEGKTLVYAPLLPRKPSRESPEESRQFDFYLDPSAIANTSVKIVVYNDALTGTGYMFKMKDFQAQSASR